MEYKKKILITGGAGFIGSNYLNTFVDKYKEYFFINVDLLTYAGKPENISVSDRKNYCLEKVDIRDLQILRTIFEEHAPTDVIHFAAETHVDFSIENPSIFIETNVLGTHNLLLLAKEKNIKRFHQISTDEVYGALQESDPAFTTSHSLAPNSPYSASKASADMLVRSYHKTFGQDTVITRCSNNYGTRQDISKLIPKAITNLLQNKKIPVYAEGKNIRDWIHVEDHIDAIDSVFHHGEAGKIYNIGGDSEIRNIEIIRKILTLLNKDESYLEFVPDRKGHDFRYAIDNSEIAQSLGWKPKISLEKGLADTVKYYKDNFI